MTKSSVNKLAAKAEELHCTLSEIAALANHFWSIGLPYTKGDAASRSDAAAAEATFAIIEREARRLAETASDLEYSIMRIEIVADINEVAE